MLFGTIGIELATFIGPISNRKAMGMGHTDYVSILNLLRELAYTGYLSAEVFPQPCGPAAAQQTIKSLPRSRSRQRLDDF